MPHVLNKFAVYTDQTGQYVVLYELQARDSVAIE